MDNMTYPKVVKKYVLLQQEEIMNIIEICNSFQYRKQRRIYWKIFQMPIRHLLFILHICSFLSYPSKTYIVPFTSPSYIHRLYPVLYLFSYDVQYYSSF